ncbi:hypothetical protein FKM82_003245 [Ascaphus truei]
MFITLVAHKWPDDCERFYKLEEFLLLAVPCFVETVLIQSCQSIRIPSALDLTVAVSLACCIERPHTFSNIHYLLPFLSKEAIPSKMPGNQSNEKII